MMSKRRPCSCHGPSDSRDSFCPTCVQNSLQNLKQLHEAAMEHRNVARDNCAQHLVADGSAGRNTTTRHNNGQQRLSELGYESDVLRERLAKLRQECSSLAVEVASQVVENDERRAQLPEEQHQQLPKEQLQRLQQALFEPGSGAMAKAILTATDAITRLRFSWALQVFSMYRLDVEKVEKRLRSKNARGIGKIGGLPLPHAGPELYAVLPPKELQSALRLVAGLTATLARCLGILLPHPILLQPHSSQGDIIESASVVSEVPQKEVAAVIEEVPSRNATTATTATASILSLMETTTWGRSAKTALQRATGKVLLPQQQQQQPQQIAPPPPPPPMLEDQVVVPPSMDSTAVSQRLLHATAAVIAEDAAGRETFAIAVAANNGSTTNGDNFAIGLQLLQNDVVALCIRVGVPVSELWPAGAVLLNLQALLLYCRQQVLRCDDQP
mmetsp:Transcript_14398/g.23777  ORF Transcript_14398/g.23777 Transcript_14398/m.23777 type:complete len:443 (-) Transcript_14398:84-1412(-)